MKKPTVIKHAFKKWRMRKNKKIYFLVFLTVLFMSTNVCQAYSITNGKDNINKSSKILSLFKKIGLLSIEDNNYYQNKGRKVEGFLKVMLLILLYVVIPGTMSLPDD